MLSLILIEYFPLFLFFLFSLILSIIILILSYIFATQGNNIEKVSAYECGFDPFNDARNQFDIRFYLVAILFLIFDLEASFIFPWVYSLNVISLYGFWSIVDFFVELIVGFIYIWQIGALDWE